MVLTQMKRLAQEFMPQFHFGFDEWTYGRVGNTTRWDFRIPFGIKVKLVKEEIKALTIKRP